MTELYRRTLHAGWGDMDFNAHMRNTAYLDKAADVRMLYFSDHGFPMREFMRLRVGPVVLKDEVEYFREAHLLDELTVTMELAGLSADHSRMRVRNEIYRAETRLARVTSLVGWLNLTERKLRPPPEALLHVIQQLTRTADFRELN